MNIKRFTAKTSREALAQVRQALGDDAVVLSTRPHGDGVEVLAQPGDGMARIEQAAARSASARPAAAAAAAAAPIVIPAPTPPRAASLAERIAARGERLLSRAEPRPTPPRLEPQVDAAVRPPALAASWPSLEVVFAAGAMMACDFALQTLMSACSHAAQAQMCAIRIVLRPSRSDERPWGDRARSDLTCRNHRCAAL